jgi:hypothetical protein
MQAGRASPIELAARLRGLGDDELIILLDSRRVSGSGIVDFFDLADALLTGPSIFAALSNLDRLTLATIAVLPPGMDAEGMDPADITRRLVALGTMESAVTAALLAARALALVDRVAGDRWAVYGPVAAELAGWPALGLPSPAQLASHAPPPALEPVSTANTRFTDRTAADVALSTTTAVEHLAFELSAAPATALPGGGLALPDSRRLAEALRVPLESVRAVITVAERAGIVALDAGQWHCLPGATAWLALPRTGRWLHLATAWFEGMPAEIRGMLAARAHSTWGTGLADYLRWRYPAAGEWIRDRATATLRDAALLGITARQAPSTAGSYLLAGNRAAAVDAMSRLFPHDEPGDAAAPASTLAPAAPAPPDAGSTASASASARIVQELRLADNAPPHPRDTAWLRRRVLAAIGARTALAVTVETPGGSLVDYLLEPTALVGGRLRARDRGTALERTLPLSGIRSITPVSP